MESLCWEDIEMRLIGEKCMDRILDMYHLFLAA